MQNAQIAAGMIALLTFVALAVGRVPGLRLNRAAIAMVAAGVVMVTGVLTLEQAEKTIDLSTIFLLLSMMVINAVLELAGFFTWVGQLVIERTRNPLALLIIIVLTGGVLSALFINDPVVLMLTPLVCGVTLRMRRNPLPYLVGLAAAANIGSAATITGNPQNILIGISSGIPYLTFLARLGPVSLLGMGIVVLVVRLLYPGEFSGAASRLTSHNLADDSPDDIDIVLNPAPHMVQSLATAQATVYVPILRKSLLVVLGLCVAFVLGVNVALAAYLAACALLISRRLPSEKILALIDWPLLLLFIGMFIVTGAIEVTGLSQAMFAQVAGLAKADNLTLALITTVLSNLISNVPTVLLFRPLVPQFDNPHQTWLLLAVVSTFAGNLTIVGSGANLIGAKQAKKFGIELSFRE
ncbi:MAG: SLC13 family permease [Anaerolineae bacterium]|nr:SLC13 family permease [Anaerolineae bacterium]